ncbi:MAG: hypothetical protein SFH39_00050 [Candidatus Magnetobacterium sp. LHC-1]
MLRAIKRNKVRRIVGSNRIKETWKALQLEKYGLLKYFGLQTNDLSRLGFAYDNSIMRAMRIKGRKIA